MDWSTVSSSGVSMGYLSLCAKANTATSIPTKRYTLTYYWHTDIQSMNLWMSFLNNQVLHRTNATPCKIVFPKLSETLKPRDVFRRRNTESEQHCTTSSQPNAFRPFILGQKQATKISRRRAQPQCSPGWWSFRGQGCGKGFDANMVPWGSERFGKVVFGHVGSFVFFPPRDHGEAPCRKTMDSVVQECS